MEQIIEHFKVLNRSKLGSDLHLCGTSKEQIDLINYLKGSDLQQMSEDISVHADDIDDEVENVIGETQILIAENVIAETEELISENIEIKRQLRNIIKENRILNGLIADLNKEKYDCIYGINKILLKIDFIVGRLNKYHPLPKNRGNNTLYNFDINRKLSEIGWIIHENYQCNRIINTHNTINDKIRLDNHEINIFLKYFHSSTFGEILNNSEFIEFNDLDENNLNQIIQHFIIIKPTIYMDAPRHYKEIDVLFVLYNKYENILNMYERTINRKYPLFKYPEHLIG
jgi:hypothetical protein